MKEVALERRNIHTYPFKYTRMPAEKFFELEKTALYIHVPFCKKKCHFCDYTISTKSNPLLRDAYVDAVCKEIRLFEKIKCFPKFEIDALYIGGGTPGILEYDQIARLVESCKNLYNFTDSAELAIEFDPHSVTYEKMAALKKIGINRVSLGVQCFDDDVLTKNNRPHSVADVRRAYDDIKRAGLTHTNLDILYPMFEQSFDQWKNSVASAIEMKPAAITAYPIEIWPGTAYHSWLEKGKALPDWQTELSMTQYAYDELESAGFKRDSTGGYFHPERIHRYCRFGDFYWQTLPMIGFGVSAKSVIHDKLYTNIQSVKEYIERLSLGQSPIDFCTRMTREQEMRRIMIRGLKQCSVSKVSFLKRFGVPMKTVFHETIQMLVKAGFLLDLEDRVELTRKGQVNDRSVYAAFYTHEDLRPPKKGEIQYGISEPLPD